MSNNYWFVEKQENTTEFDTQKTHDGVQEVEFTRKVSKSIVRGYYNGKPVAAGFLKFGPRFDAQEQQTQKQNTNAL